MNFSAIGNEIAQSMANARARWPAPRCAAYRAKCQVLDREIFEIGLLNGQARRRRRIVERMKSWFAV